MAAADYVDQVQNLYIAYFGRPADTVGLAFWTAQVNAANGDLSAAIAGFSASAESVGLYGGVSVADKVSAIYHNLFNRAPETAGLNFWVAKIASGEVSDVLAAYQILSSAGPGDATAIANKLTVAKAFTAALDTPAEVAGYSGFASAALARAFLARVDSTAFNLNQATAALNTGVADATGTGISSPAPAAPTFTAVTVAAGGTYNGTVGLQDRYSSTIANLNGTIIAGNAADTDTLTLTTAGTLSLNNGSTGGILSNIKVLNLANGTNTITYNTSAGITSIKGGAGDDTFIPNMTLLPIAIDGGAGTDTIVLSAAYAAYAATASGSGTFASNVTNIEKLRLTSVTNQSIDLTTLGNYNDVTVGSGANGLTLSNLASNGNVALTGFGTALTLSNTAFAGGLNDIVNLSLSDGNNAAVAFATTGITASGVETANIRVNDTQTTPTGAFNDTLTWQGNSVKTINVSGNAGLTLSATSTALTTVDASGITLGGFTWTSSALTGRATVKGSSSGTNTVNLNSATVGVDYTGGAGNDNVTINGTVSSTAALGNGNNSLALNGVTILGTYTGGSTGIDSLAFFSATPDISQATISGFENLTVVNNANITMTAAQLAQFTGTVNASGTETVNLTTTGTVTAISTIEKYNLASGTNNFTSANVAVDVAGGTGADTFNFSANQIINFLTGVNGGNGTDILNIGTTTTQTIDLSTKVSNIEIINVAGSTGTASFTNVNGAGVTLNYTKSTGDNTITLGSGGQTLNLLGASFASTEIRGGAAVDVINLQSSGSGSETLIEAGATMSNRTQIDVVGNFNATGTDYFKTGVNAVSIGSYIIGNADTGNYLAIIGAGLPVVLNNTGQAYLITIQTGSAAGTYLFQNTGSDTSQFDNTDFFVQLSGTIGTISNGNLIA